MQSITKPTLGLSIPDNENLSALDLHLPKLKIVSYRGPGQSSGVACSLEPIIKQLQTKIDWLAISGQPGISAAHSNFFFHTPQISQAILERHAKISYQYIYPFWHELLPTVDFDNNLWKSFRQFSQIVASETMSIASQSFPTLCWINDYQMALVSPLLATQAGVILSFFWHIPWPKTEIALQVPVIKELVDALLSNKIVGFQTNESAMNFLSTVQEIAPQTHVDFLNMSIKHGRTITRVLVMPVGIDFDFWQDIASKSPSIGSSLASKYKLGSKLVLGVDKLIPSRGILEKLDGLEEFLEHAVHWQKQFSYVQIAYASRGDSESSKLYAKQVTEKIASINSKYQTIDWKPISLLNGYFDKRELAAWYQAADVLAVNSLKDGINLVAKEFVASRTDEQGALILSKQSGSAPELSQGALFVDPLNKEDFCKNLSQALSMSLEEKHRRMAAMRRTVSWNKLQDWALTFLHESIAVKTS